MKVVFTASLYVTRLDGTGIDVDLADLQDELECRIKDDVLRMAPIGYDDDVDVRLCNVEVSSIQEVLPAVS